MIIVIDINIILFYKMHILVFINSEANMHQLRGLCSSRSTGAPNRKGAPRSSVVIGLLSQYAKGAIQLFGKQQPHHLVIQSHAGKGKAVGPGLVHRG